MIGTILSFTRMGQRGFCTSVAVEIDGVLTQIRPRMPRKPDTPGNMPLHFNSYGMNEEQIRNRWTPGRRIAFDSVNDVLVKERRPTHPEDRYLDGKVVLLDEVLTPGELEKLVKLFVFRRLEDLFPGLETTLHLKGYVRQRPLPRSVGYIRGNIIIGRDDTCTVRDIFSRRVECRIKDEELLAKIRDHQVTTGTEFRQALIRFSLSDPTERKCHLMVSHVLAA